MDPIALSKIGVWVRHNFISERLRLAIVADAAAAQYVPESVERAGVGLLLDPEVRRTSKFRIGEALAAELDGMVAALAADLPEDLLPRDAVHLPFQKFLCYQPGDHFRPHSDDHLTPYGPDRSKVARRSTIVLVGLSDPDDYEGGELELYGLLGNGPGSPFAECGIPVKIPVGAAVSYRSSVVHAVRPVTSGVRYVASGAFGFILPSPAD